MGLEPRQSSRLGGLNNCMVCPCLTDNKPGRLRFQRPCCKYLSMFSKDPSILKKYHEEEVSAGVIVSRELTEFSMLRSIPSNKKAASVHTLWMEETTVPLEAGTPKINVQMESKSNCRGESEDESRAVFSSRDPHKF